jgi:hypothetical protein
MIQLRDLTDESGGSCDWGGCDDEPVAERWGGEEHGWLPVCQRHTGPRNKPSPGKAPCGHCGKVYALTTHGLVRLHVVEGFERCPGSGRAPMATEPAVRV